MTRVLTRGGRLLLQFGLGAGVVAAVLPTLVSSKLGTRALVSTINYTMPGVVEVDEIHVGWTKPVMVKGVRVLDNTGQDHRLLLSVQRVSSTASLLQMVTGQSTVVTVAKPIIDATLADDGTDFRFIKFLEDGGLMTKDPATAPRFLDDSAGAQAQSSTQAAGSNQSAVSIKPAPISPLSQPTSQVQLHADLRAYTAQVYVVDGTLRVPEEFRQLLGESMHVAAVMGAEQLQDSKEELDLDLSWLEAADAATGSSSKLPGQPAMAEIRSSTISASVVGWKRKDDFLLQRPASASLEVTPSLLRFGLSQANPLLKGVVDLHEGGRISAFFSPQGGAIPYSSASVRVEPMKLTLVTDSIIGQLMDFIGRRGDASRMEGLSGQAAVGARLLDLFGHATPSSQPTSEAGEEAGRHTRTVQVWTSAMQWDITKAGRLATHRLDMMLGPPRSSIHVALWGSCDRASDKIDMSLGLPASTLRRLGLKNLPSDFMLTLDIGGTASKPKINWLAASKKIAALAAVEVKSHAPSDKERWMDHILNSATVFVNKESVDTTVARIMAESLSVPAPGEPLPWEQPAS